MCISANELNTKIAERRSLKTLIKEAEAELKAIEIEIIGFMTENEKDEHFGPDYKLTYTPRSRGTIVEELLMKEFNIDNLDPYKKFSHWKQLDVR